MTQGQRTIRIRTETYERLKLTTLVEGDVPPDHATRIVVGVLTGGKSEEAAGFGKLLEMATKQ